MYTLELTCVLNTQTQKERRRKSAFVAKSLRGKFVEILLEILLKFYEDSFLKVFYTQHACFTCVGAFEVHENQ